MADQLVMRSNIEIVGQASTGQQAVELAHILRPDVILMDIQMPGLTGIEATRQIRALLPEVQVLIFSGFDDEEYIRSALKVGASGFMLKTSSADQIAKAVEQIYEGNLAISTTTGPGYNLSSVVDNRRTGGGALDDDVDYELTDRELEVLRLLALGLTNRSIAKTLSISDRTVQAHLTHIFAKMRVISRLDAVLKGIRSGMLPNVNNAQEQYHRDDDARGG
ncbi:MAG: response regulator transcription factor [Chloroflexi bacterium]|nr:response regulator transcription factor [Chloroflexota bacterium]